MSQFILGVGGQKCGTTWLHYYLGTHKFVDFGFEKEYHIFDARTLPECEFFLENMVLKVATQMEGGLKGLRDSTHLYRLNFVANPQSYYDYFRSVLNAEGIKITGDITPSYAGLSIDTLRAIRRNFRRRGVEVRPVFLMRDPVYRLQSMVRMHFRDTKRKPTREDELAAMRKAQDSPGERMRANYQTTLENLYKVFGRDGVYVELYERLFDTPALDRLGQFLDVTLSEPPVDKEVNVSRTSNVLGQGEYAAFKSRYESVYDEVARMTGFPIDEFWRWKQPKRT
ncbi:sulfotransferase [Mesobacterium pallidum]|uniref:sulfotransferase n=1 Tax=Mesobacterium pallidum TaxID=2872037 RepID=UPI001EE34A2D|nr:sulfotransferase [Mesobacterium pallidum]